MESEYIHGFSRSEQNRLSQLQAIINEKQIRSMRLDDVKRVLDIGSGLGQFAIRLGNELIHRGTPSPSIIGIERDQRQLDQCLALHAPNAEASIVEFRLGDATALPLADQEWNSFDLVHCRFILEHCPAPEKILTEAAKAVRPGGQVFILDDDHELLRLDPACPELSALWTKYWQSYEAVDCDPLIGRSVPRWCGQAGLEVVSVDTLFFGATQGEPLFELVVDNIIRVIDSARQLMISKSFADDSDFDLASKAAANWRQSKNATVWYSLPYTTATKS